MTVPALHTHVFGSDAPDAPVVLALHGLTGHGRRWGRLAALLPEIRVVAPDLLGHGHSPWEPPWAIVDQVAAVAAVLDARRPAPPAPVVVVAHSFGSAVAIALAHERPDLVAGLVLLDPAQGLDPATAGRYAELSQAHRGYRSPDEAVAAKRAEGWGEVADEILADEVEHHLTVAGDALVWRVSGPAVATSWSEMARGFRLPPETVRTHVVVADRVDPPFVTPAFLTACTTQRADTVTVHHADTEHMVPFLAPDLCAGLVLDLVRP